MAVRHITSTEDPHLAPYQQVRDRDALGPDGRPGLFIGESPVVITAMMHSGVEVLSILTSNRHAERAVAMVEQARGSLGHTRDPEVLLVPDDVLDATVGFNIHRGFLAVGRRPAQRIVREVIPAHDQDALLLLVEEINNIDNIGQLFRNAAAFGCSAVILSPGCHDPLYRKSLRVSCGCVLRVPYARGCAWNDDLRYLRDEEGFTLLGATGGGDSTLRQVAERLAPPHQQPRRIAVVMGAEFTGLCADTLAMCTERVKIPMAIGVDSLNVGVAAGVFLSRLTEQ
ncbi:MAG: RNA methyltransferase [Planctomycetota bacterium]|nr:RNA methyltransferase [Planctomycetota bacterium]